MDNFNYGTNDSLIAVTYNNGWVLASSTVNPLRATATALTYSGYVGSGVGSAVPMANNGQDACKDLKNAQTYTSGSVYASCLVNVSAAQATGDYVFGLLPSASISLYSARTFIKLSSTGYFKVAIMKGSTTLETTNYSVDSFPLSTTLLFVAKYTFYSGTTADDSLKLYVFSSGIPATEPAVATCATIGGTNTDMANVGRVFLRQGSASNAPTFVVDEIRISNTWANGPLPVTIHSFKGILNNNSVALFWSTSSEMNNRGFEVERSTDGKEFETIGFVKGSGTSNKVINYLFTDNNAKAPILYYRLKQIDFDGKNSYTDVLTLSNDKIDIGITPNPFVDEISIRSENASQEITAELFDLNGRSQKVVSGNGNVVISTQELLNGVYFIRINNGDRVLVKRILKN